MIKFSPILICASCAVRMYGRMKRNDETILFGFRAVCAAKDMMSFNAYPRRSHYAAVHIIREY
jgi:hypothetical protein